MVTMKKNEKQDVVKCVANLGYSKEILSILLKEKLTTKQLDSILKELEDMASYELNIALLENGIINEEEYYGNVG